MGMSRRSNSLPRPGRPYPECIRPRLSGVPGRASIVRIPIATTAL